MDNNQLRLFNDQQKLPSFNKLQNDLRRALDSAFENSKTQPISDDDLRVPSILLSMAAVGPKVRALTKYTGYSQSEISRILSRAKETGIVTKNGKLDVEWFETEHGYLAILLDAMVIDGTLERVK